MGVKNFIKKSVALISALAMTFSVITVPKSVSFAETETDNGLELSKKAVLQENGTYTITLESYVTGNVTLTKEQLPCDIVLVLDQSGSMTENMNGITRKQALQNAANQFISDVKDTNVDHRIAIVGFAGGEYSPSTDYPKYINTELFIGSTQYNYSSTYIANSGSTYPTRNNPTYAGDKYDEAFQNVQQIEGMANLQASINNLSAKGGTKVQWGMEMANQIFAANDNTLDAETQRKRIVVVFTDGDPGENSDNTWDDYSQLTGNDKLNNKRYVADEAIKRSYTSKNTYDASIYSIGIFDNADEDFDISQTSDKAYSNRFMQFISSNYQSAQSMNSNTSGGRTGYYKSTQNADKLKDIFKDIFKIEVGGQASIELDKTAVVKDIISDNFDLPENYDESKVKVKTATYKGNEEWNAAQVLGDADIDITGKTISVSNFNYKENYVAEATSATSAKGKKLIIEIIDIVANTAGLNLDTNDGTSSGVYDGSGNLVELFPLPKVNIPRHNYVLDYGKSVVTKTIKDDCGLSTVSRYNTLKPSPYETRTTGEYGTFDLTKVGSGGTITYTPGKINWNGFDSTYVFGQVSAKEYLWSAVSFIPATSVYYEDDFAVSTNTDKDSNVSIIWSDNGWNVETDKQSSKDNSQSNTNSQYGWDNSYVDDTQFSNGSSYWTEKSRATATFRFTGTGVDVYSRTNKDVGVITARIKRVNNDNTLTGVGGKTIDNQSLSSGEGSYYQIPTLFFDGLEYGTYEVTITVLPYTEKDGTIRGKYYLDGIRVYHPLNPDELDPVASEAYEEAGESNAKYITLRNDLIDSNTSKEITSKIEGNVFIDKSNKLVADETNIIGTYKDYGPKNEVYLGNEHGVAFTVDGYDSKTDKVFVGLKSITGKETTVSITGETSARTISSAADLYYEVKPDSNGNVVITNNTDNILSVTKVRITTKSAQNNRILVATPQLMSYAADFEISEDNQTDNELGEDDVIIDNPSDSEDEVEDNNNQEEANTSNSIWDKIINSLKKWFKR